MFRLLFLVVFVLVDLHGNELGEFPDMATCKSFAAELDAYCVFREI